MCNVAMEIRVIVYREQTSVLLFYAEDEAATANGSVSVGEERKRKEATDAYRGYKEIIKANVEYEYFIKHIQGDKW